MRRRRRRRRRPSVWQREAKAAAGKRPIDPAAKASNAKKSKGGETQPTPKIEPKAKTSAESAGNAAGLSDALAKMLEAAKAGSAGAK